MSKIGRGGCKCGAKGKRQGMRKGENGGRQEYALMGKKEEERNKGG